VAADEKVIVGQTHGAEDAEAVLIGYLMGVEALRASKQAVMWLTKDGVYLVTPGFVDQIDVPGAPSVPALHKEYVDRGGRFFACPVCIKTHGLEGAALVEGAEVKGAPAVYEFAEGGALTFNY